MSQTIAKYLARHAEPEAKAGARLPGPFRRRVVIPAFAEGERVVEALASIPSAGGEPVLIVVVNNARVDASAEQRAACARSWEAAAALFPRCETLTDHIHVCDHPRGTLVWIDRVQHDPLPRDQGVGLARKIGLDFALAQAATDELTGWLHMTDADARLPADYFSAPAAEEERISTDAVAMTYPYVHEIDPTVGDAIEPYEIHLRLHVRGLAHAGSPYAHATIGSTIAVRPQAYAAVRGMPKRKAGEDFHFLSKVRKLGPIAARTGAPIILSGRRSDRVPFGTGRAMQEVQSPERVTTYHPQTYRLLKQALSAMADSESWDALHARLSPVLGGALLDALAQERVAATLENAASHPPRTRPHHLCVGFDALRTLRVVHRLRDMGLGLVPIRQAVRDAEWIPLDPTLSLHAMVEALRALDGVTPEVSA